MLSQFQMLMLHGYSLASLLPTVSVVSLGHVDRGCSFGGHSASLKNRSLRLSLEGFPERAA